MAKNRYVGSYPVIGIRPIIDGRRGPMKLRESLESQVMAMAEVAKKLFEDTLYYSNGDHVKVVIADSTIGRVPESAACAEKFRREGVSITLSVTPCWCYGSETMDMDPMTIKGVWGFNGTERPGAVYLASVLATHAQKGLPAFGIYGHEVQDADQVTEIPEDVKEIFPLPAPCGDFQGVQPETGDEQGVDEQPERFIWDDLRLRKVALRDLRRVAVKALCRHKQRVVMG